MHFISFLSAALIPLTLFNIVLYGFCCQKPVFELFLKGGKEGLHTVLEIAPTIIGLLTAIGVFRASGALTLLCRLLSPAAKLMHIPPELLPLSLLKLCSASGANGLLFDLFKNYGTDSFPGLAASILLSCTETLLYTVSVYTTRVQVKKTRWLVPAGLFIALVSLLASVWLAGLITGAAG